LNYILLFTFTLCETFLLGSICSKYDPRIVEMAMVATAVVTLSLTIYAFNTKNDISVF
jgi:FtsH-binding integral membrane protein